jgi:acetyl-CoA carboxylase biotin carboxyl carrier protein
VSLTGKDIAEIAHLLDSSHFTSLDLQMGEFRLKLRRGGGGGGRGWSDEPREEDRAPALPASKPAPASAVPAAAAAAQAGEVDVIAPLLGNFYITPRPGEPAFVNVGDRVTPDSIIAIIEVMKLMNSVRAGVSGTVTAVLVENGSAVEAGQPVMRVRTD